MRKRLNNKLWDAAFEHDFGDFKSETSRTKVSPDDKEELDLIHAIRADLKSLSDVPPSQLSNERLRDAILGQGLHPGSIHTSELKFGWLWMPCGAFVVSFALFIALHPSRSMSESRPTLVGVNSLNTESRSNVVALKAPHVPITRGSKVTPETGAFVLTSPRKKPRHRHSLKYLESPIAVAAKLDLKANTVYKGSAMPIVSSVAVASTQPDQTRLIEFPAITADASTAPPIVMIDTESDSESGAQKATEVRGTSHVLVGG